MTVDPALLGEITVSSRRPAFQSSFCKLIECIGATGYLKQLPIRSTILRKIPGLEVGGDGSLLI